MKCDNCKLNNDDCTVNRLDPKAVENCQEYIPMPDDWCNDDFEEPKKED